jgi:biopolymer transport protein ExbD
MAQDAMDLKVVALDRVYRNVPRQTLCQWAVEGRIAQADLVAPVGTQSWSSVLEQPWLSAAMPRGVLRPATEATEFDPEVEADAATSWVARRSKRKYDEAEMDMTPMIDVTFQLLIFFMLTNSLANPAPLAVAEAEYGRGVTPEGKQIILVDERGRYYLGDSTREEAVAPSLDALVAEVRRNASQLDGAMDVIVTAHKQSKHVQVRELVDRLGDVPNIGQIMLGVVEKRQ